MKNFLVKKKIYMFTCLIAVVLLGGCEVENTPHNNNETEQGKLVQATETTDTEEKDMPGEEEMRGMEAMPEADPGEEQELKDIVQNQEKLYIGEYLDYDNAEPNLEIAKREDGKYIVQIGIFRLCSLDDGVGELTAEGMVFTATDPAGNPISGVITVEEGLAKVIFTDSTWEYLENGSTFQYTKSSDSPNVWSN